MTDRLEMMHNGLGSIPVHVARKTCGIESRAKKHPRSKTMEGFFDAAREINPWVADSAHKIIRGLKPFLVVNRITGKNDTKAGKTIQKMLREFLSIESTEVKTIREDRAVGHAVARMKPVLIESLNSFFAADVEEIVREFQGWVGEKIL